MIDAHVANVLNATEMFTSEALSVVLVNFTSVPTNTRQGICKYSTHILVIYPGLLWWLEAVWVKAMHRHQTESETPSEFFLTEGKSFL